MVERAPYKTKGSESIMSVGNGPEPWLGAKPNTFNSVGCRFLYCPKPISVRNVAGWGTLLTVAALKLTLIMFGKQCALTSLVSQIDSLHILCGFG